VDNELENQFLIVQGISDPEVREQIITAGLDVSSLDPSLTPRALERFQTLIADKLKAGKTITRGRLGNIDTRVATINKTAEIERSGFGVLFEFPVVINKAGNKRFIDIVQTDFDTGKPIVGFQLMKAKKGKVIREDEEIAIEQIRKAVDFSVEFINTRKER